MPEHSHSSRQQTELSSVHDLHFVSDTLNALLEQIAVMAAETIDIDSSAGITVIRNGQSGTVASSDDRTRSLDEIQYGHGDGPCLEAARTGRVITVPDADSETRWPDAIAAARARGLRSSLSVPLELQDLAVGALNIYAFEHYDFSDDNNLAVIVQFCTEASRAISLGLRHDELATERDHLHAAMATRKTIDQALGIIMAQNRCSPDEAFTILRKASQNRNIKVRDLAAEIIQRLTGSTPTNETHFK